jgi:ABC-type bacteriocin/lantibiotic exporter with double-glycine peptidase domain
MELDRVVSKGLNDGLMLTPLTSLQRLLLEVFFSRPFWKLMIVLCSLIATFFGLLGPFLQKEFIDHLIVNHALSGAFLFQSFFGAGI